MLNIACGDKEKFKQATINSLNNVLEIKSHSPRIWVHLPHSTFFSEIKHQSFRV